MAYGPTSPMGGIRIFYSSSLLWDSALSPIRVKVLLTLTLGSRDHIHPEFWIIPPFFKMRVRFCCTMPMDRRILLSRTPCVVPCRFLAPKVFSDVDIALAMSRCVIPHRVPAHRLVCLAACVSKLTLSADIQFCAWICMSLMTTNMYLMHFLFISHVTS